MLLLVKNLLFTFVVPGTVGVYVPLWMTRGESIGSGVSLISGLLMFALGGLIYGWCVWDFATFGRGTPAPIDAPKKLVVRGLYRFSRNPMYVGVLTVLLGWVILHPQLDLIVYALVVALSFNLFVIFYEEPHLHELFGESYTEYRGRVRRWL